MTIFHSSSPHAVTFPQLLLSGAPLWRPFVLVLLNVHSVLLQTRSFPFLMVKILKYWIPHPVMLIPSKLVFIQPFGVWEKVVCWVFSDVTRWGWISCFMLLVWMIQYLCGERTEEQLSKRQRRVRIFLSPHMCPYLYSVFLLESEAEHESTIGLSSAVHVDLKWLVASISRGDMACVWTKEKSWINGGGVIYVLQQGSLGKKKMVTRFPNKICNM